MRFGTLTMIPLLGGLAILQTVVGPQLSIAGVRPDIVLLALLLWTLLNGSRSGIVLAFFGGVWMDILSGGPMGSSSLALIGATLVAGFGYRRFYFTNPLVPLLTGLLGTLTYSLLYLAILLLSGYPLPLGQTLGRLVLPQLLYNTVLMVLLGALIGRLPFFQAESERI